MKINTQSQPSDNWVSQEMTASTGSYVAFLGPHQQTEGGGFMEERSPGPEERFESSFLRLRCQRLLQSWPDLSHRTGVGLHVWVGQPSIMPGLH